MRNERKKRIGLLMVLVMMMTLIFWGEKRGSFMKSEEENGKWEMIEQKILGLGKLPSLSKANLIFNVLHHDVI